MPETAAFTMRDRGRWLNFALLAGIPGVFVVLLALMLVTGSVQGSSVPALTAIAVCAGIMIVLAVLARAAAKSCVIADPQADDIVVRHMFRRRTVRWSDVEAFDINRGPGPFSFPQVYLFRVDARPVRLPLDYRRRGQRRPVQLQNAAVLNEWFERYRQRSGPG